MIKLTDYQEEIIDRGLVLRCKGKFPFEKLVDFLFCETPGQNQLKLITISGYKAGLQFCIFPEESIPEGRRCQMYTKWLIDNWGEYGYFDCPIEDVYIFESPIPPGGGDGYRDLII